MRDVDQTAQALQKWCQRRGVKRGTEEFLSYLADKDQLYLLPSVLRRLQNTADQKRKEKTAKIDSARELKSDDLAKLNKDTASLSVESSVDQSLLAGLQVTYRNRRTDGTLKNQLKNLHTSLTK
jgi:F-type H+-transporting ATPase subunit delta